MEVKIYIDATSFYTDIIEVHMLYIYTIPLIESFTGSDREYYIINQYNR